MHLYEPSLLQLNIWSGGWLHLIEFGHLQLKEIRSNFVEKGEQAHQNGADVLKDTHDCHNGGGGGGDAD